ncbi:hypothetical protein DSO57_1019689 [Entomophthora muscae]|uniref:Uncharacterized protein n=1 Tax=Entomophthora muscae TaxID=34485 RepID=A0ACC2RUZ3_9FUNG|nr:hypothetical protein DSO57_1019689 [Entomophthora muscae]
MNYIIFTAVLTAYLEIGGNHPTYAQFCPEPQGTKGIFYNEPTHPNSMNLNLCTPLASSQPTPNLANYVIPAVMLLYLAVSLRQCIILAKAFFQAINLYPIVYALNSFEPPDLPSYVTKVLPSILGYSRSRFEGNNFRSSQLRLLTRFLLVTKSERSCPLNNGKKKRSDLRDLEK